MPGMWCLARLKCRFGHGEFYGVLAEGHGLYAPALIDAADGCLVQADKSRYSIWFAEWLKDAFRTRGCQETPLRIRRLRSLRAKPLVVNCLDSCYGHSLPKLLSVQYYLEHYPDYDLIVILPRCLEWLIPDGVAEAWISDGPLDGLRAWDDALARRFSDLVSQWPEAWIAACPAGVHCTEFEIQRFTRVEPFDVSAFAADENPKVTFIWRDDRFAFSERSAIRRTWLRVLQRMAPEWSRRVRVRLQLEYVNQIGKALRSRLPALDFAVVGMGVRGAGLAGWITDMRSLVLEEDTERAWCDRYAQSHIVIGVHGSNMLLPSAHAGAVLTLMPNGYPLYLCFTDTILNGRGALHPTMSTLLRYKTVPLGTNADTIAEWVMATLQAFPALTRIWTLPACQTAEHVSCSFL